MAIVWIELIFRHGFSDYDSESAKSESVGLHLQLSIIHPVAMLYYKTILAAATLGLASSFSSPIIAITQSGVTTRSAVHLQFGNAVRTTPCITSPVLLLRRHI